MIISASYKTDIPAFYEEWFLNRLRAGYAIAENPISGKPFTVSLSTKDADGIIFWTKNATNFLTALDEVDKRGIPFVVQYAINGYPQELEGRVVDQDLTITNLKTIASSYSNKTVVWRYDPVLFTSLTPPEFHLRNFERIAISLAGTVDQVVISFAQIYHKTERNLNAAAAKHGFSWTNPSVSEKQDLLFSLATIAYRNSISPRLCSQPELLVGGVEPAACVDKYRLSEIAGREIKAKPKGNREGCGCFESRDIGSYDTCAHGCVYCYAVSNHESAECIYREHDPTAEMLGKK